MVYVLICFGIQIFFLEVVRTNIFSTIIVIAMVLPVPFIPLFLAMFTRLVYIELSPDQFNFEIMNRRGSVVKTIELSAIESYCIQFPSSRFASIRFNVNNGKSREFSFLRKKKGVSDVDATELIETFRKAINDYNSRKEIVRKILLRPSFYASNGGHYCIIGLSVLLSAGVLLALHKGKSVPLTFLTSLLLIFQLVSKRKDELRYYRSMEIGAP
jgi:hypothetical protein